MGDVDKMEVTRGKAEGTENQSDLFELPEMKEAAQKEVQEDIFTEEDARKEGWGDKEIKDARELGVIQDKKKEDPKEKEPEASEQKQEEPKEEEQKKDEKTEEKARKRAEAEKYALDEEGERNLKSLFGEKSNVHGLYHNLKGTRARLKESQERETLAKEEIRLREQKIQELTAQLNVAKAQPDQGDGEEGDEEDKPLTKRELAKMFEENRKAAEEKTKALNIEQQRIALALKKQESQAREIYEDFDDVVLKGAEMVKNDFEDLQDSPVLLRRAKYLIKSIQETALKGDSLGPDEYTVADLGYELGKLHPSFQNAEKTSTNANSERRDGGLTTDDKVQRIEKNVSRRGSSASLPGSKGTRQISPENITEDELASLSQKQFEDFSRKYPKIVRKFGL